MAQPLDRADLGAPSPMPPGSVPLTVAPRETIPPAIQAWKPDAAPREWKFIVLHHTATETGDVASIHEAHLKNKDKNGNHWLGIGYHFVIGNGSGMRDGEIEPTFRWREQMHGAHAGVGDYNQQGIGIVLVGNFEKHPPSTLQLEAAKHLVSTLAAQYGIPAENVLGHGDVKATECPGAFFPLQEIRASVAVAFRSAFPLLQTRATSIYRRTALPHAATAN
jgi:N-acetyl-anhydromuramyl-L-alanine amidase AmpD